MNKQAIVKKVAESLGLSKRQAEYHVSFILDLIILEAELTGKVKIDSHVFYRRTTSPRKWMCKLHGIMRSTPTVHFVAYRNTRKFKNPDRLKGIPNDLGTNMDNK